MRLKETEMTIHLKTLCAGLSVLVLAAGCASQQPLPFQLVDSESKIHKGTFFPDGQRIEAMIDGKLYKGFYIIATQIAYSETLGGWRGGPRETVTTATSNSAKAHMASDNGSQLNCTFLFESKQAIGECKSPAGKIFQLTADGINH